MTGDRREAAGGRNGAGVAGGGDSRHHSGMRMLKLCALVCLLLAACGGGDDREKVTVFAAASMTDAVNELADGFTGSDVKTSFGASSDLARQIKDGAPADVYISASGNWIEYLKKHGKLEGEPVVIARNELVCVTWKGSDFERKDLADLGARPCLTAIADEGVPAGEYTRQAMAKAGVLETLKPSLVGQSDVRAVVMAVQSRNAPIGFVYSTDAAAFGDKLEVLFAVPAGMHDPVGYYAAQVKGATNPDAARAFIEYLQSDGARETLKKLGFREP